MTPPPPPRPKIGMSGEAGVSETWSQNSVGFLQNFPKRVQDSQNFLEIPPNFLKFCRVNLPIHFAKKPPCRSEVRSPSATRVINPCLVFFRNKLDTWQRLRPHNIQRNNSPFQPGMDNRTFAATGPGGERIGEKGEGECGGGGGRGSFVSLSLFNSNSIYLQFRGNSWLTEASKPRYNALEAFVALKNSISKNHDMSGEAGLSEEIRREDGGPPPLCRSNSLRRDFSRVDPPLGGAFAKILHAIPGVNVQRG